MFDGKKLVAIVDIETRQDAETGERFKYVSSGKKLISKVDFSGIQTRQLGELKGFDISYSVEIPRIQFNKEKYCFFDDQLFEIKITAKAKLPTNMLLHVAELEDEELEDVVRTWVNGEVSNASI